MLAWLLRSHLPLQGASRGSATATANADGTLASGQTYTACPLWGCSAALREGTTRSGSVPTDRQYTGQISEPQLGIYFYNARYYDPYLARFISPDTLIPQPGNPLAWDRYAYVRYNPVRYNDPSGNRECDETDRYGRCFFAPRKIMILACGDGLGANCKGDYSDYGDIKPLSHFEKDAYQKGYDEVIYFGADSYKGNVKQYAAAINNYMIGQGSDARFTIIGHSRGGAAVIWAASDYVTIEEDSKSISRIILLDTTLQTGKDRKDTQDSISTLEGNGISISSYNSWQYYAYDLLKIVDLPDGSMNSEFSFSHLSLATNPLYWFSFDYIDELQ
jgi:RHS repeat-associated protein